MNDYRRLPHLVIITAVAALLLVLTAYKANQNTQRLARFRERNLREKAAYQLGREVNDRMRMAFKARVTIDAFEEAFGPVTELTDVTDKKQADMTHSFFHDGSQRTFYLRFQDGRLVGTKSNHGTGDVDTGVVLETPAFLRTEAVRASVLTGGLIAWCLVLLIGICIRRFRRNAAVILVVLSMACGLSWLLAPNYSPTLHGISSNDNLATFGLMLVCSLAFGIAVLARPFRDADARERSHSPEEPAAADALLRAAER